ncbi:LysR family transcriptional regulator [Proteus hauseri ATCC 700826]|uniref:LysR family transcriptional regulator n=1 Tax=Proteus hauseri ATCC 700826 TaxID=1354271 RepID=A0AAJ3LUB3_PROHU|nr:LysR family transcriptional regulator [Proteus hauseri]OAT48274.1 LysR family transcriptional regulator [Proteus hauseri ATCC 700826]
MDKIKASEVFVTIVKQGSMIKAADYLGMSRAMVTRYLNEMEEWAGVRLLHRTTRKQSLTSVGEQVYQQSLQLLEMAEQIPANVVKESHQISGLVRITSSQSLANSVLSVAISEFMLIYPLIAVDLQITNQTVNLVEERIDIALRITNHLEPNLIARPLATCISVVCASNDYLAQKGVPKTPDELAHHQCLTYRFFGRSLWEFNQGDERFSVPVEGNLSANESVVLLQATLRNAGISLQPYYSVKPYLENGELIQILSDYQAQPMGIYAVLASRQNMPAAVRALLDFLVEWFSLSPHWNALSGSHFLNNQLVRKSLR